jgi:RimJ/RimL family protein N-acetyltransferase
MLNIELFDAKKHPLKEKEILKIVEIERHPEVKKWLYEYEKQDFKEEFDDYRVFFKDLLRNDKVDAIIARSDASIIGFLCLWRRGVHMEHVASIGISVHPDYWGRGVATQLVKFGIELSKAKGLKRLEIETLSNNVGMRRVAERLGFKLEGVREKRVLKNGSYFDEVLYFMSL